jgi:mannosyltransferase OCH1-like enzyme
MNDNSNAQINKTIYMTYKTIPPYYVFNRWKVLNPDYNIELSLDKQCYDFMKTHFNEYVANLFNKIPQGMHKADLWRLCKLFIHSGVYSDIDLVPYLNLNTLDKDITFYSCLATNTSAVFQAFIVNFSKPKNPLLLLFLISFLVNEPYKIKYCSYGPCIDMMNVLKYNLNTDNICADKVYDIEQVKLKINIGSSQSNNKSVNLYYFPHDVIYEIKLNDETDKLFNFNITENILKATRIDKTEGWEENLSCDICISSKERIYLFKENNGLDDNLASAFVTYNNIKVFNSHDINYVIHKNKK